MKFHHIGIEVADLTIAKQFYLDVLGFYEELYMEVNEEKILFLKRNDLRLELVEAAIDDINQGDRYHICFEMDSFEKVKQMGYEIIEGPTTLENGWEILFVEGSEGESIEFLIRRGKK